MNKIILFLLFGLLMGCTSKPPAEKYPDKLVIGFPVGSEAAYWNKIFIPFREYLKKTLRLKSVDLFTSTDYAAIIEAMKTKKVDVAYFGELAYIIAHEKAGAEPMLMLKTKDDSPLPTNSIIITYPGSGITSMEDVRKRSHELTIVFADPASASGHLYPRDFLNSIGLDPEKSFKQVVFSQGHAEAILSIVSHKTDLACTFIGMPNYMIYKGKLSPTDYVVIWTSKPYPSAPVSIRKDLPEGFKKQVKQAYLDLPEKDPAVWKNMVHILGMFYPKNVQDKMIYGETADSIYDPIRKVAQEMPYTNFTK